MCVPVQGKPAKVKGPRAVQQYAYDSYFQVRTTCSVCSRVVFDMVSRPYTNAHECMLRNNVTLCICPQLSLLWAILQADINLPVFVHHVCMEWCFRPGLLACLLGRCRSFLDSSLSSRSLSSSRSACVYGQPAPTLGIMYAVGDDTTNTCINIIPRSYVHVWNRCAKYASTPRTPPPRCVVMGRRWRGMLLYHCAADCCQVHRRASYCGACTTA